MIKQKDLSAISNRSQENGARRIPESVIERDYCISWFLFGLSQSPLRELLIFKGGTALRRCHFADYRFSEDLDFTLEQVRPLEEILAELNGIFEWIEEESGISFGLGKVEDAHQYSYTFYLTYQGPIPNKENNVKVDVTFKETLLHPTKDMSIIKTYDEYNDFLEDATIRVYALEEVIIEKICALLTPFRNEPRDLYDLYYLTEDEGIEIGFLVDDIEAKLKYKDRSLDQFKDQFDKKETRLEKLWKSRLEAQMSSLPEYEAVYRAVKRTLRQAKIID